MFREMIQEEVGRYQINQKKIGDALEQLAPFAETKKRTYYGLPIIVAILIIAVIGLYIKR